MTDDDSDYSILHNRDGWLHFEVWLANTDTTEREAEELFDALADVVADCNQNAHVSATLNHEPPPWAIEKAREQA